MTQEQKELLLKELCARLPYGVMCQVDDGAAGLNDGKLVEIDISKELVRFDADYHWDAYIDDIKPYLFPLSSMTDEQEEELIKLINTGQNDNNEFMRSLCRIDFYHKHHFDYRGLIRMGLANDATNLNIY